jgi:hypothetical protein
MSFLLEQAKGVDERGSGAAQLPVEHAASLACAGSIANTSAMSNAFSNFGGEM